MPAITPLQLLVIQPTSFCNLDCTYCYLPDRGNRASMSTGTLAAIGRSIVASPLFSDDTTLVWHAGEPCVLPPDWYRAAIATIERAAGRRIPRQSMQTNATLLGDDWIRFIREEGISVGVSLDGPAAINDKRRVTRAGKGTHAAALEGIGRLRAAGVRFHLIAVVTAEALEAPEAFARALAETGAWSIGLNIEEVDGTNAQSSLFDARPEARYGRFLERFLDTLDSLDDPPRLREYDRFLAALKNGKAPTRHMENVPGAIISVTRTGDLSTFSPELPGTAAPRYDDFVFGNVNRMSDVARMFLHPAYLRALIDVQEGVSRCRRSCAHFSVCGGGSPSNKLGENGSFATTETMFCRLSVKTTFDTFLTRVGIEV